MQTGQRGDEGVPAGAAQLAALAERQRAVEAALEALRDEVRPRKGSAAPSRRTAAARPRYTWFMQVHAGSCRLTLHLAVR